MLTMKNMSDNPEVRDPLTANFSNTVAIKEDVVPNNILVKK